MKNQKNGIWLTPDNFVPISGKELTSTKEVATRLRHNGGYTDLYLPDPDIVLQKLGRGLEAYRELLPDAHMTSIVGSRKAGVKSLFWKIEANDAPEDEFRLIDEIFQNLKITDLIDEILDAPLFGYQPIEITWTSKNGRIVPGVIQGKPPEWFVFDDDNQLRFRSASSVVGELLPPGKFLLATHGATYANPYGKKLLSSCFWPVMFKKGGIKFWTQFVERFGGAFAIGKYPRGAQTTEIDDLATMLVSLLQSAVAAVPDDASVEIIESAGKSASGDMHNAYCDFFNAEMSKAIIGQTLTTEAGSSGSYALGGVHATVRQDIIDSDAILVTTVFQQLISLTHMLNFGGDKMPKFKFWSEDGVDKTQAERDSTLTATGQIRFRKKYFKKTYGFEDDDFDVVTGGTTAINQSNIPEPSEFREREPAPRSRDEVDMLTDNLNPEQLQKEMQGILKPIIELIEKGQDYKQIMEELVTTYDGMSNDALIELLERAFFVAEVWGRLNGRGK
jgi:phage gp29-like protein